jgi:hypothetical protein
MHFVKVLHGFYEKIRSDGVFMKFPTLFISHGDHLIPLMVVAGAAALDQGKKLFVDMAFGVTMSSYQFG